MTPQEIVDCLSAPDAMSTSTAKRKAKKKKPTTTDVAVAGVLGDIASAVLMEILYAARMGRFDLIRPVSA